MKLDFQWPNDSNVHSYCVVCRNETVIRQKANGKTQYYCSTCRKPYDRWIKIDPGINWWISEDGEYWHESSGVFVRSNEQKFLFFKRNVFPFCLTVPSGHIDTGENAHTAAQRELEEEVGLGGPLTAIATCDITGDECSRGADSHKWHAFLLTLNNLPEIIVKEEGGSPVWLSLDEALDQELTVPVKYMIERYYDQLSVK